MFRRLAGVCICAGAMLASSIDDLSAETSDDNTSNAPFAIFDDETYRRDGALTRFRTCLAIADDPKVQSVWDDEAFADARKVPAYELAETLLGLDDHVRLKRGFGTVLACAHVVSAWYAKTIGDDPDYPFLNRYVGNPPSDGRFEHGATVVDLDLGKGLRAFIEPAALTRILTSPGLLPRASFGGVVVRNAIINGPLVMHNLHLTSPLTFVDVKFIAKPFSKDLFGNPRETEHTALAVAYSQFDHHVLIANSEICGKVNIKDSHFRETLAFERVTQRTLGCQPVAKADGSSLPKVSVWISSTRFEQGLSFVGSHLDFLRVIGNRIDSFVASTSSFGRTLRLWENDIGSLQVNCSILAETADISFNQVQKDLFVFGTKTGGDYGPDKQGCDDWWRDPEENRLPEGHQTALKITSNRIGGGLGLLDLDGTLTASPINLASNRVGNGSEVWLPSDIAEGRQWSGVVNLEGSTYQGRIEIGTDAKAPADTEREQGAKRTVDGAYCLPMNDDDPIAVIEFRAAHIRTLAWNLPFECDYRWRGYGLVYDLWIAGEDAKTSTAIGGTIEDQEALQIWRQTLAFPEAASLDAMSRYLTSKGSYVDSRDILLEAKRLSYAPGCQPDVGAWRCIVEAFAPPSKGQGMLAAQAQSGDAGETGSHADTLLDRLQGALMLFLLAPGGYGAQPERALILIALTAVGFYAIYFGYSLWLRSKLNDVPSLIEDIKSQAPRRLAAPATAGLSRPGMSEPPQQPYDYGPCSPLIQNWPTAEEWSGYRRDERLEKIQNLLKNEIAPCLNTASGDLLRSVKDLRGELERFGNTQTLGFSLFDKGKMPTRFTHWRYSIDTMLPVIDLHAYGTYYPVSGWLRFASVLQHVLGWWWLTVFIASAAIL